MAEAQITKAALLAAASQQQQQQRSASRPHLLYQPLVPIRIDVTCTKQNLRIIDTLLMDPQVWPVPLVFERCLNDGNDGHGNDDDDDDGNVDAVAFHLNNNNSSSKSSSSSRRIQVRATEDSIEANVRFLAHNVLTDAEVQGMGRTTRHFTGRADLWSVSLQECIMDQIRPQIQVIAQDYAAEAYYYYWNIGQRKKRQRQAYYSSRAVVEEPKAAAKKAKTTNEEVKPDHQQQPLVTATAIPVAPPPNPPPSCYVPTLLEQARFQYLARAIKESSSSSSSCLIPIRIRMSVHGIRIHDDFLWDPNLHLTTTTTMTATCINALEFARITGKDLNLPDEAIHAMAVDIVEQIHGLTMCRDDNKNSNNDNIYKQELLEIIATEKKKQINSSSNEPAHRSKHNITAAWLLDSRKHAMDAAHLVSQHRPTAPPNSN